MKDWITELVEEKPDAICLHGRTAKQKYGGISSWENISEAVKIIEGSGIITIGNGDVKNISEGKVRAKESGVDGIMIGRAILNNPWMFRENKKEISKEDRLKMLVKHAVLFEKYYKNIKNFNNFRKYLKCYVS
jgi:tRNA-dihydrouridine synthase